MTAMHETKQDPAMQTATSRLTYLAQFKKVTIILGINSANWADADAVVIVNNSNSSLLVLP